MIRSIELARLGYGVALLTAPRTALQSIDTERLDSRAVVVTRILGARHVVQATLSGLNPSPVVLAAGVWVDSVHSVTAVGLAVADPKRARAGLVDAAAAAVWARAGWRDLLSAMATDPRHERRRDRLARVLLPHLPGGPRVLAKADAARSAKRSVESACCSGHAG